MLDLEGQEVAFTTPPHFAFTIPPHFFSLLAWQKEG